jgi:hypothetical protein
VIVIVLVDDFFLEDVNLCLVFDTSHLENKNTQLMLSMHIHSIKSNVNQAMTRNTKGNAQINLVMKG